MGQNRWSVIKSSWCFVQGQGTQIPASNRVAHTDYNFSFKRYEPHLDPMSTQYSPMCALTCTSVHVCLCAHTSVRTHTHNIPFKERIKH